MAAKGVCVGDRVRVETTSYEGVVKSYDHLTHEMHTLTDDGTNHYFDPTLADVTVTIVPPAFKTGQVWETPDGAYWFIRRAAKTEFCAMPSGHKVNVSTPEMFLDMLPKLIFPVAS